MEYNYMSFLMDFCFMSLLLVIAQFLRAKIKFFQMFYIPASLLAGIMGLLLGPQFANIIPWSGQIGSYAYMLVCVLFGGLFLGKKEKISPKKIFNKVGDSFCVNMGAEFFCFGTNDLTQMTYGFSRDDAGKFLNAYYDKKIFESDPFAKLDQTGVGKLMETAIKLGKPVNPKLHVGICGEHGGDPSSVEFCHKIGLDYVSCSPFRVPIARLAAAQAAIANK